MMRKWASVNTKKKRVQTSSSSLATQILAKLSHTIPSDTSNSSPRKGSNGACVYH